MSENAFTLGNEVIDEVSRFKGVVTAITEYRHTCPRGIKVQPRVRADGSAVDPRWFDESELELVV